MSSPAMSYIADTGAVSLLSAQVPLLLSTCQNRDSTNAQTALINDTVSNDARARE